MYLCTYTFFKIINFFEFLSEKFIFQWRRGNNSYICVNIVNLAFIKPIGISAYNIQWHVEEKIKRICQRLVVSYDYDYLGYFCWELLKKKKKRILLAAILRILLGRHRWRYRWGSKWTHDLRMLIHCKCAFKLQVNCWD